MNHGDRNRLIEMGRQFTPSLFADSDPSTIKDEIVLDQMGNAMSQLHARIEAARVEVAEARREADAAIAKAAEAQQEAERAIAAAEASRTLAGSNFNGALAGSNFNGALAGSNFNGESPGNPLSAPRSGPQPSAEAVATWLTTQHLTVQERTVLLTTVDGRKRQSYRARERTATIDDVLSYRLDAMTGDLHLVMTDGRTHRLPFSE